MEEIARLCRKDIYSIQPYTSTRAHGSSDFIHLDANESPYPPFPGSDDLIGLNRYPEPQSQHLLEQFSKLYQVDQNQLFFSRGADEAIDLLTRAFCQAGNDGILISPPTFVMYETSAKIQGANVYRVPLLENDGFQLNVEGMVLEHQRNLNIKLVFVCSPNNPTSNLMRRADILNLADALFGKALVVVDQLYVDYSGEPSLINEIAAHPNIVVLRSLSKEYSLAGERFGITVAHSEVISILRRIVAPYSISQSAIRAVTKAITPEGIVYGQKIIGILLAERKRIEDALRQFSGVDVFPSDANFLLVKVPDANLLTKMMENNGIKIRNRNSEIENTVRISIGTPQENDQMLKVFNSTINSN